MPKRSSGTTAGAFNIADLRQEREQSVAHALALFERELEQSTTQALQTGETAGRIIPFADQFSINLQTSSRYVADRVVAMLQNTRVRNYDFAVARGRDDWEIKCHRRQKPLRKTQPISGPTAFDPDMVFTRVVKANAAAIEPRVIDALREIRNRAFESMPLYAGSFQMLIEHTPRAIVLLAFERLRRAQTEGWRVRLELVHDHAHRLHFIPPRTK